MVFIIIYKNRSIRTGRLRLRTKADFLKARDNQFVNLDRRIGEITEDLPNFFRKQLTSISENNAATACDYIIALNREISLEVIEGTISIFYAPFPSS